VPRVTRWACTAGLACVLVAAQASAASLVQVRVGRHADYTRVVLETDAPVRYELARPAGGEIRVRLFANAAPRRLASKSSLLREVVVESDPAGSVARLALAGRGAVDVKEMVLDHPPRIVIDLVPSKRGAPALAKAAKPAAAAAPAPQAAPQRAPEAAAVAAPEAPSEPETVRAPAVAPVPEPAAEPEPAATAPDDELDERAARDAAAQAELDRLAGIAPGSASAPSPQAAPEEAPSEAVGEAPPGEESAAAEPDTSDEEGERAGLAAAPGGDEPPPEVAAIPPRSFEESRGGKLPFLPTPLDEPVVFGVVVLLLALVAGLALLRRRGAQVAGDRTLASPFASADAFAYAGGGAMPGKAWDAPDAAAAASSAPDRDMGPLFASAGAVEDSELAEEPAAAMESGSDDESIFDVEAESADVPVPKEPSARPYFSSPAPRATSVGEATAAAAGIGAGALGGEVMRVIEELERRIAHLETRLEEVVDAKERLERHVAAQTEELRVQRAAIARTQRVLRTVVKPEDVATEPAPK
jgi:hypothetical protein